jgi:uncharacterized protein with FMN-binding domain
MPLCRGLSSLGLASALAAASLPAHAAAGHWPDGTYTGARANAYYGFVQVKVVVTGGTISSFWLLEAPSHTGTSVAINRYALPILAQEVVTAQSPTVDAVSGATLTSEAFMASVRSALPN